MAGASGYKRANPLKYILTFVQILPVLVFAQSMLWGQDTSWQDYTMQDVLAHNDYQKSKPFNGAYGHRVGILEADLYYRDGLIKVAHDPSELDDALDLERTYLKPLKKRIRQFGKPYPEQNLNLALMLDIKNEPEKILEWIHHLVRKYPELFGTAGTPGQVPIIISGFRPPQNTWKDLPASVFVDGRLSDSLSTSLRSKVYMVSSSFSAVVPGSWTRNHLTPVQIASVQEAIDQVHRQKLKIRFWGVPDNPYFWNLQRELGVDIIGCDHLDELAKYLSGE